MNYVYSINIYFFCVGNRWITLGKIHNGAVESLFPFKVDINEKTDLYVGL